MSFVIVLDRLHEYSKCHIEQSKISLRFFSSFAALRTHNDLGSIFNSYNKSIEVELVEMQLWIINFKRFIQKPKIGLTKIQFQLTLTTVRLQYQLRALRFLLFHKVLLLE